MGGAGRIPTLHVGDMARDLYVAHWIKGPPVIEFEPGRIYVVEFWATWCGPCVAAMPEMSKLQAQFAADGVSVIGLSDEPLWVVVEFLTSRDEADGVLHYARAQYALGADPDMSAYRDYMSAAGESSLPKAFVIGKTGRVEWIGAPNELEGPLAALVQDKWGPSDYVAQQTAKEERRKRIEEARRRFGELSEKADWPAALALLDELIRDDPDYPNWPVTKFMILACEQGRYDAAYRFLKDHLESSWNNWFVLNNFAWMIVDDERLKVRDLDLAYKLALRANELTNSRSAYVLDTVARIAFERGDKREALKRQQAAMLYIDDSKPYSKELRGELTERLHQYEEAVRKLPPK